MLDPSTDSPADIRARLLTLGCCAQLWPASSPRGVPVSPHICFQPAGHDGPHRCPCAAATPKAVRR